MRKKKLIKQLIKIALLLILMLNLFPSRSFAEGNKSAGENTGQIEFYNEEKKASPIKKLSKLPQTGEKREVVFIIIGVILIAFTIFSKKAEMRGVDD